MTRVLVAGSGIAGTGAALSAARAGASVTLIDGGPGASSLTTGALDVLPWTAAGASAARVGQEAREVLDAIGGHVLGPRGARLVTTAGVVRPARGREASLLDVDAGVPGDGAVGVVACERPGWDAQTLAAAWGESARDIPFVVVGAAIERHTDERDLPDADFAARHDDDARLAWLADRLRAAIAGKTGRPRALVLPPCLGLERGQADALSDRVGVPCGEALASPGGPAGLRSEHARRRALAGAGVEVIEARVTGASRAGGGWIVELDDGRRAEVDAVVFAIGGLIGGGMEYAPAESVLATALPPFSRPPFRLGLDAPLPLGAHGLPLDLPSTLFGSAPERLAWPFARDPLLGRVGVLADAQGKVAPGLFAAGELLADRPRTWLDALSTGVAAGAAAATVTISAERRSRSSFPAPPIQS
jgi:glycerol-3-phosphate dehydrogenase subunit B